MNGKTRSAVEAEKRRARERCKNSKKMTRKRRECSSLATTTYRLRHCLTNPEGSLSTTLGNESHSLLVQWVEQVVQPHRQCARLQSPVEAAPAVWTTAGFLTDAVFLSNPTHRASVNHRPATTARLRK